MPLLAAFKPIVAAIAAAPPLPPTTGIAAARDRAHALADQTYRSLAQEAPPVRSERDATVGVPGYAVPVRIYRPRPGRLPVHVYFHGGGFWLGTLEQSDSYCRRLAQDSDRVVVSVDYRLAPEHPFPTPFEDCYAALGWTVAQSGALDVDPARVSVGGGSAGGALAAAVTLAARDRGGPRLGFQVLEIPVTDLTMAQPSIRENAQGPVLTEDSIRQYVGYYLNDPADATHPYASPLHAPDVHGLPPAFVTTAEFDPLRDEGEAYAHRLTAAGVPVELVRYDGHFHGSFTMSTLVPDEAAAYTARLVTALTTALPTPLNPPLLRSTRPCLTRPAAPDRSA